EPALDIKDFMQAGTINLLHADRLMETPKLYGAFLLWLLSSLFQVLPEAGDLEKPKLVFFFDEAHLLLSEGPPKLMGTIERVVRLARPRGVGVYFVTKPPGDVPDSVLAQLGNGVQHALRAYTEKERRALKGVAESFRPPVGIDGGKKAREWL